MGWGSDGGVRPWWGRGRWEAADQVETVMGVNWVKSDRWRAGRLEKGSDRRSKDKKSR